MLVVVAAVSAAKMDLDNHMTAVARSAVSFA